MKLGIMKSLYCAISLFAFVGCSQVQEFTLKASALNLKNAEVGRQAIDEFMSTWSLNSGAIQCGTEEIIPAITLRDLQRLDQLVKDAGKWSDQDFSRGCFAGITIKMTARETQALIERLIGMAMKGGL